MAEIQGSGLLEVQGLGLWYAEAGVTASFQIKISSQIAVNAYPRNQKTKSIPGSRVPELPTRQSVAGLPGPPSPEQNLTACLEENHGSHTATSLPDCTCPVSLNPPSDRGTSVDHGYPSTAQGGGTAPEKVEPLWKVPRPQEARTEEVGFAQTIRVKPVFYLEMTGDSPQSERDLDKETLTDIDQLCISLEEPCLDAPAFAGEQEVQIRQARRTHGAEASTGSADPAKGLRVDGHVKKLGCNVWEISFRATVAGQYKPTLLVNGRPVNLGNCFTRVSFLWAISAVGLITLWELAIYT